MVARRPRPGYTLLELLVAVAIVAVLIGLLLGAVQKIRNAAYRAQSHNGFRNVGLATHSYEATNLTLPGLAEPQNARSPAATQFNASLFFVLLPHAEGGNLFRAGAATRAAYADASKRVFKPYLVSADDSAPSGVVPDAGDAAAGNLAANTALFGKYAVNTNPSPAVPISSWYKFTNYNARRKLGGVPDGTTQTVMFAEKRAVCGYGGSAWAVTDQSAVNGVPQAPADWVYDKSGADLFPHLAAYSFPMSYHLWYLAGGVGTPPTEGCSPGGARQRTPQNRPGLSECSPLVPQGLTVGGAVVSLADGSSRFVRDSIDVATWFYLSVPDDGKTVDIP